jgi:hypothetical protein
MCFGARYSIPRSSRCDDGFEDGKAAFERVDLLGVAVALVPLPQPEPVLATLDARTAECDRSTVTLEGVDDMRAAEATATSDMQVGLCTWSSRAYIQVALGNE